MAFSSGTFTIDTVNTPVVTGTTISSTVYNAVNTEIAAGLTTCVLKDGTQTTTASVPFVFGLTSGANIVSDTDSTDDLGTSTVRWANVYTDSIGDSGRALDVNSVSIRLNDGVIFINEQTTPDSNQATYGQDWVENLTPSLRKHTDDGGTTHMMYISLGTEVNGPDAESVTFSNIPAGVTRIALCLTAVSTDGTDGLIVQIGDSGGLETSVYVSSAKDGTTAVNATNGFIISVGTAASDLVHGTVILFREDSITWTCCGTIKQVDGTVTVFAGSKALSAVLDRVSITTTLGTELFDNGALNIQFE